MQKTELLIPGKFYHIYNCGINGEDIFRITADYQHFLRLYERYIEPVCETYAWVLMKNHFHFFIKVKKNIVYKCSNDDGFYSKDRFNEIKWETVQLSKLNADSLPSAELSDLTEYQTCQCPITGGSNSSKIKDNNPLSHQHFSHLFNAYAKYYNKRYNRHGSLFERPFKRKLVSSSRYFRSLVVYIHQNPVNHGFCKHPMEYGWSSYLTCISVKPTCIKRKELIGWFDDTGNFKYHHEKKLHIERIEHWLGL